MTSVMQVEVVDSEKSIFSGEVEFLVASSISGEVGIYPHHAPLIIKLKPGVLRLKLVGKAQHLIFAVSGGFLEVQHNHLTVLADIIERTDELDEKRLQEQQKEAMAKLESAKSLSSLEVARAQASLEVSIAQLKALEYLKRLANRA
jgi:F-type H+-transporting ATPase subunit epsilon